MGTIPLRPTSGLDDPQQKRRDRETINDILTFRADDWRKRTAAEISAGITPTNFAYEPGNVKRYGATGDGTTNDTSAISNAIATTHRVIFPTGTYQVDGGSLAATTAGQMLIGEGVERSIIRRRSNGTILALQAADIFVGNLTIVGDDSVSFTGDNITGNDSALRCTLDTVRCYRTQGSCVNANIPSHWTIRRGYYDNTNASSGTPTIIFGRSGLSDWHTYWNIDGAQVQPTANPIRVISSGSGAISNSQIGGLELQDGSFSSTANRVIGNRITGTISDESDNTTYCGNVCAGNVTFQSGSSGIFWIGNIRAGGTTITDSGTSNVIVERNLSVGILNIVGNAMLNNNTTFRLYDSAGTNYAHLLMTSSNNFQVTNNNGALQLGANSTNQVQLINGGAVRAEVISNGEFAVRAGFIQSGDISPAQITANTDNYNPTGLSTAAVLRLSTDASRNLTGIAGGADGRVLKIFNVGSFDLVLINDATSTAANRFLLGADTTLNPNEGIDLWYDATSSRWRASGRHN